MAVGKYETLVPPASFVIAGPGLGRLLIIIGLALAALVAGFLNYRRRSRHGRRGGPRPA